MHALAQGQHHLRAGAVHRVARGHQRRPRLQRVINSHLIHVRALVDAENGANGHVAVDVGGAVERVKHHNVLAGFGAGQQHWLRILHTDHKDDVMFFRKERARQG